MARIANEEGQALHRPALRIAGSNDTAPANHRQAALALLNDCPGLSHKEAGFLGHVAVAPVLSAKQQDWLVKLLDRNGLPPLAEGGENV